MASGDTKTEQMLNVLGNGGSVDEFRSCCNTKTQQYILDAIDRVQDVEDEVEELKNNPDVVDIVDTYADLQAYDTQHLTENDIIRVLQDETHSGNSTYYRFTKNPDTWTFIGEVSGGVNVVQTTGTSTTDVMSQNATSTLIFPIPTNKEIIGIGVGTSNHTQATAVGGYAQAGNQGVSIGYMSGEGTGTQNYITNIGCLSGRNPSSGQKGSVSLGAYSKATMTGEVNVGSTDTSCGYNSTNYRIISGVHDGQNAHDAVTVNQVNSLIDNLNSALSTNIPHIGA